MFGRRRRDNPPGREHVAEAAGPHAQTKAELASDESRTLRQSGELDGWALRAEPAQPWGLETDMTVTAADAQLRAGASYSALDGVHDEMCAPDGTIRPAYAPIAAWFDSASEDAKRSRARKCERMLFDFFSDPQAGTQPWHLDIMPLAYDAETWEQIEMAALQRARLYDAILADLYGPQTLLTSGTLPLDLILNDSSFLRPLHGTAPAQGRLAFLALDFARDPAGQWRVIDAHTETPAGHGFVLANRTVMAEISPDLFRYAKTLPIGPFYHALAESMYARTGTESPAVALLTGQPDGGAFLGHSYMARYLGFLQVQGSDLRVIDNQIYLKTIDGLKRIDVLLRAIEGRLSDPLELAPDGFDGPVGLAEAARQNSALIANALGTAVVENRGMSPFLGGVARALLGEELLVPDTLRLWLGEASVRENVLQDLDRYVIHEAQEGTGRPGQAKSGLRSAKMTDQERETLVARIGLDAPLLVAEQPSGFATAPAWSDEGLAPRPYALRVFVAATQDGFRVMPGGVALNIDDDDAAVALTSHDARSRDVWVRSDSARTQGVTTLSRIAEARSDIHRHAHDLQSRVADNLFWLGRYCERAETMLRLVRQALTQSAPDLAPTGLNARPTRALNHILEKDGLPAPGPGARSMPAYGADAAATDLVTAIEELCTNSGRAYALPQTIESIRQTAVQCRERLSLDSWRILTGLTARNLTCVRSNVEVFPPQGEAAGDGGLAMADQLTNVHDLVENADALLTQLSAFAGLTFENMTRSQGRQFLDMGRRLERAQQLVELLDGLFSQGGDDEEERDNLTFALFVADSYMTFRARYRFAPDLKRVLDLLLIDETNPRSLAFQLSTLAEQIDALPKSSDDAVRSPDQRQALQLLTQTRLVDLDALVKRDASGGRPELQRLLSTLKKELPQLSETLSRHYFSLADDQPQRLLGQFPG